MSLDKWLVGHPKRTKELVEKEKEQEKMRENEEICVDESSDPP
jgi:hypothetical protein